ncbi:hypothetical protein F4778DRAFT_746924 [Xylariomycetidae sp. FL2044]|nr:hypothetical protein F4778DRAFT_746924 [Xylariomycetidae sp. FL2044]
MKQNLSLLALAAGLSQVTATFFHNAPSFTCPENTDNTCLDDFKNGIDWSDLSFGSFDDYKGFKWTGGWTCAEKFGKRDELSKRTFQSKCATAKATNQKSSSPKISCDSSKGNSKTSIKTFQVTPDFDCDLEFHYTMPDQSTCKHRSSCKASGTVVENTQCGGATDVTIVFPDQEKHKDKTECNFGFHHIDFDCDDHPKSSSSISVPAATSTSSKPVVVTSSSKAAETTTSSKAAETTSSSKPAESTTTSFAPVLNTTSQAVETSTYAISTTSVSVPAVSSTAAVSSSASSLIITSYDSTSTVFSTTVQTITSCGPEVPDCPAHSTAVTTIVVPISTTVCPVTETLGVSTPASPAPAASSTASSAPVESAPVASSSTTAVGSSSTTPTGPVETLPCPDVVPSCMNTWLFKLNCKDNTDSACYCPDSAFVQNVFTCMYAHGETDDIISEAISYFQGICAPFVPTNPGIATGADTITSVITVVQPTTAPAAVTTVVVTATQVVPCTNEAGEEIPSSSSTVTITTTFTAPEVIFTTVPAAAGSSSEVAVVPGTYTSAIASATATATNTGVSPPYPTGGASTLVTAAPTGGFTSAPSSTPIVTAGAAHVGAGMGFLGVVALAFAL